MSQAPNTDELSDSFLNICAYTGINLTQAHTLHAWHKNEINQLRTKLLEARIAELKRAKMQSYITGPQMHKVNRRIESLQAEVAKLEGSAE